MDKEWYLENITERNVIDDKGKNADAAQNEKVKIDREQKGLDMDFVE